MTTINSIIDMLVKSGLNEAEASEMAEHEFNTAPTYAELAEMDAEYANRYYEEEYDWGDYGYDYDEPVEESSITYLDDVLSELDKNTDVKIFLNSANIIYGGFGVAPVVLQDCIGNHKACNWSDALHLIHMHHMLDAQYSDTMYRVLSVVREDANTVSIYLDATREDNGTVHGLEYAGNLYASRWAY